MSSAGDASPRNRLRRARSLRLPQPARAGENDSSVGYTFEALRCPWDSIPHPSHIGPGDDTPLCLPPHTLLIPHPPHLISEIQGSHFPLLPSLFSPDPRSFRDPLEIDSRYDCFSSLPVFFSISFRFLSRPFAYLQYLLRVTARSWNSGKNQLLDFIMENFSLLC